MSRTTLALALLALAAAAAWAWRHYAPEKLPAFARPPRAEPAAGTGPIADEPNPPLYKWRDDAGQWHITDTPPKGRAFEKVVVDPGVNVIPSILSGDEQRAAEDGEAAEQ